MNEHNYQGESFLNRLYKDLHMSTEVIRTASPSDTKDEKVRKYLDRLEKVEALARDSKYNGLELLKEMYYKKYVIKPENVPESYFDIKKKIALEKGFGHVEISDYEKSAMVDFIIQDQRKSLDMWLDYFFSSDALYPEWFKYYAFQGMLKLGSYDKVKSSFNKRTNTTTNVFIDLNREALALVYDNLCSVLNGEQIDDYELQKLLESGSFSKLYAYMLQKIASSKKDITDSGDGRWIKYNRGSKPDELVKSLEGKGTGWCTVGIKTACRQLKGGDFYVYYTKDSNGEYAQPRIAICMEGNSISEIRGINENQNLEHEMEEVLAKKLEEFPGIDKYKKRVKDMEMLTLIYKECQVRELTIEELRFLYEIDGKILGFGYNKDPRINEILSGRNYKKDLARIFNCKENQVSNNFGDVLGNKGIVCYVGDIDYYNHLKEVNGLKLPDIILGNLDLRALTSAKRLIMPSYLGGRLDLRNLESAEGLKLPNIIGGSLNLSSLNSAVGLTLPDSIGGYLNLSSLTYAESLVFPNNIGNDLCLDGLVSAKNLIFSDNVGGSLELGNLESAENLVFPTSIGYDLNLQKLRNAKGLILPTNIGYDLCLSSLVSTDGLIVPKKFNYYRLNAYYITMDNLIDKSLENGKNSFKQRGFSKVGILILLNLIISISLVFLGVWFDL